MARVWHLASRPVGMPKPENFVLKDVPSPALEPGMVRVKNMWLSVDPYMRGLMDAVEVYMPPLPLGSPMIGGAIGEVTESRDDAYKPGDLVRHMQGWRDESVLKAVTATRLPRSKVPVQRYLGHLGMPGMTAYFGLLSVAEAKMGETLFVSGAAGTVGSAVVQIAKIKGLTVIASAGGPDKCAFVKDLGADVAIDYRAPGSMDEKLRAAAPGGIDVYFDNVGGDHLDAAMLCAKLNARFAMCGMIGAYNSTKPMELKNPMHIIRARIKLHGFMAPDFYGRHDEFLSEMVGWVEQGRLRSQETVREGLEATPRAFLELFSGGNVGKMLVKV